MLANQGISLSFYGTRFGCFLRANNLKSIEGGGLPVLEALSTDQQIACRDAEDGHPDSVGMCGRPLAAYVFSRRMRTGVAGENDILFLVNDSPGFSAWWDLEANLFRKPGFP